LGSILTATIKTADHILYEDRLFFTSSKTNFNGTRVWFLCPGCKRRVGCLYLPSFSYPDKLLCRKCHNLAYKCQNKHKSYEWEVGDKFVHRQAKVHKKLQNKWLRLPTKQRLIKEDIELGKRIDIGVRLYLARMLVRLKRKRVRSNRSN